MLCRNGPGDHWHLAEDALFSRLSVLIEEKHRDNRKEKVRLAALLDCLRQGGWIPGKVARWTPEDVVRNYTILARTSTRSKTLPLACVSVEMLAAHRPDTVRGNMYLVVSAGWLPDTSDQSYDRIQRLLVRLRENGTILFAWVVDNVRSTIKPSSWSGLADFADTVRDAYRLNFWASLPEYIEVIVEKDTVAGKLAVVTQEYDVPLHPIRGYNSTTFCHNIARGWDEITKPITIYYVGDHDPSGRDLERDVQERLARYGKRPFSWQRLAISPEQFSAYNVRPLVPKKKDARTKKFVERWGKDCAEVEAVPATELRRIVREAVESHIPQSRWAELKEQEKRERELWAQTMQSINWQR
jgi:hypothetical protein